MVQLDAAKDLAAMFNPPQGERYAGMRYGQGVILTFDSDTFENTVGFRGLTLTNVPILNGPDALTYQPGTVVALVGWAPNGGFGAWWILGRVITPGVGAAEEAIDFLATSLGAAVSAGVIGERVHFNEESGNADVNYPSGGFVDPDSGVPGPEVTDVEISDSGRAIVLVGAIVIPGTAGSGTHVARMGFEVTGASSLSPSINRSAGIFTANPGFLEVNRSELITGLNAGLHTFTAKYSAETVSGTPPGFARWNGRYIQVIGF